MKYARPILRFVTFCMLTAFYLGGADGSSAQAAESIDAVEIEDWTVTTDSTPDGKTKSVSAMTSAVSGEGKSFDIIFIKMECIDGLVALSMSKPFAAKSRIFDAVFLRSDVGFQKGKHLITYWRTDEGGRDGVLDGSPEALFTELGDGAFGVMTEGEDGKQTYFLAEVSRTQQAFSRVKSNCKTVAK